MVLKHNVFYGLNHVQKDIMIMEEGDYVLVHTANVILILMMMDLVINV